jgi:hypothetical protein
MVMLLASTIETGLLGGSEAMPQHDSGDSLAGVVHDQSQGILTFDKTLPVAEEGASWIQWSPDGRSIAYISDPSGELTILDVATGKNKTVVIPNVNELGGIVAIAWSPDGQFIAMHNRVLLVVASAVEFRNIAQFKRPGNCVMTEALSFAKDSKAIIVGCQADKNKPTLLLKISFDGTINKLLDIPPIGPGKTSSRNSRIQNIKGKQIFSILVHYSLLEPLAPRPPDLLQQIEEDVRAARYRCYFYDLSDPKAAPRSLDLGGDNKEGLDGSGFGRSPSLCAVSPSTGLALVQRRNAGEVRTSPPYPTRDKEFEVYDLQTGNRIAFSAAGRARKRSGLGLGISILSCPGSSRRPGTMRGNKTAPAC